jgi:hypothetical protein
MYGRGKGDCGQREIMRSLSIIITLFVELDRIADFINKMFFFFNLSTIVVGQIL